MFFLLRLIPVRTLVLALAALVLMQAAGLDVITMLIDAIASLLPDWTDLL